MRSGIAEVNGARLYYELRGEGPPVVLIHGFTLDRRMWDGVVAALAPRFSVLAYDVRGQGGSDAPGGARYAHRDDLRALLDHLALGPAHVVGHSLGGHQALEFVLAYPDLARSYTGVCVSGLGGVAFPDDVRQAFAAISAAARHESIDAAKAIWRRVGWFTPALERADVARQLDAILADYSGWHWQNDNPTLPLDPPPSARLGEIAVPALILLGALDLPYNHVVAERLARGIPGARQVVVPAAGHMLPMEDPAATSAALSHFLGC